jgi:hypothetical protein
MPLSTRFRRGGQSGCKRNGSVEHWSNYAGFTFRPVKNKWNRDAKSQVFTYSTDSSKRLTQIMVGTTVLRTFMYL